MSSCCNETTVSLVFGQGKQLFAGDHIQNGNVMPSAGVVYQYGQLLKIDADNKATLATDAGDWNGICGITADADEVTYRVANDIMIPMYNQGEYHIEAILLGTDPIPEADWNKAIACGNKINIELRKPDNNSGGF
jgi:hypothetical protein